MAEAVLASPAQGKISKIKQNKTAHVTLPPLNQEALLLNQSDVGFAQASCSLRLILASSYILGCPQRG